MHCLVSYKYVASDPGRPGVCRAKCGFRAVWSMRPTKTAIF